MATERYGRGTTVQPGARFTKYLTICPKIIERSINQSIKFKT